MYKNQLQELAQRSCFNLPCYASIREGPDHAPRFKASVNFNGEIFECPSYCNTLRQAEHAAAEVALNSLSTRGPSRSLTARVLDETGVYKNLLQETVHKAGMKLPVYTTVRSGPGHVPVFTSTVEIGGMNFTGDSAKTKKQAEKNAAIAAWSALKNMPKLSSFSQSTKETNNPEDLVRRKRDQNQARRRTMKGGGHREHGSNYTAPTQQWRSLDLLLDSSSACSGCSTKKQNSLVSLLPPPPPIPNSKILPLTSLFSSSTTRPAPSQLLVKPPVKLQEAPPPLDEHQMDENGWLIRKTVNSTVVPSADDSIYTPIQLVNTGKLGASVLDQSIQNEKTHIRNKLLGAPTTPSAVPPSSIKRPPCGHMGMTTYAGRYSPQWIAPSVQIRSVIPVCAAPPQAMRLARSNPSSVNEAASASANSISKHTGVEEASSASPKSNNPESYSTHLGSLFNQKLQL